VTNMPQWAAHLRPRLSSLRLSPAREDEIIEELSQHLEDRWRELVAGGASDDDATRLAGVDVLALDQALETLSSIDARQCRVVELRFVAGLNIAEAAEALAISPATVEREWRLPRHGSIGGCLRTRNLKFSRGAHVCA
jgi:DNA-directed RNA polymerase specialized sigma24 family protein